jgi:DNA-binding LytR/AlgR family response regulator
MEKYVLFNTRDTMLRISQTQIVRFSANGNYTDMFLTTGKKFTFTSGLGQMKQHLETSLKEDARYFVRLGKSAIINLRFVYRIDLQNHILELYDPVTDKFFRLEVSKGALKKLKDFLRKEYG